MYQYAMAKVVRLLVKQVRQDKILNRFETVKVFASTIIHVKRTARALLTINPIESSAKNRKRWLSN